MFRSGVAPRCLVLLTGGAFLLTACSGQPVLRSLATSPGAPATILGDVPFFPQRAYQCGPAALASLLVRSGVSVTPEGLRPKVYLPGRHGSLQVELLAASRRLGRIPFVIDADLRAMSAEMQMGRPVLVLQNLGLKIRPVWHYAVVIGLDPARDEIILHSGAQPRLRLPADKFLKTWTRAGRWGMVVLRPEELPADPHPHRYLKTLSAMESIGDPTILETAFATALARWPANRLARFGLANAYLVQGDFDRAVSSYQQLLQLDPRHIPARNNLAMALAGQTCTAAAMAELNRAAQIDESSGGHFASALRQTREELFGTRLALKRAPGCDP